MGGKVKMKNLSFSKEFLNELEEYFQKLLDVFYSVHEDYNIQIFFTSGQWGFIDDGYFNDIGSFDELVEWLKSHCQECSELWSKVGGN